MASNIWEEYHRRLDSFGVTKIGLRKDYLNRRIFNYLPENLSYTEVELFMPEDTVNIDSEEVSNKKVIQNVAVINSDNLNEKKLLSLPGDDIRLGTLVHWMDEYWLVVERDANTTVYTRTKMMQCNHLLKWIDEESKSIMTQWSIVEDGTKYLTGELEDRNFVTTRGDSRISLQLSKNRYTSAFGRQNRFLIDDPDSHHKLSYILTKPLKMDYLSGGSSVYKFVLQEVTATEDDNHELGVADYYKYFDKVTGDLISNDGNDREEYVGGRRNLL